MAAKVFIDGAAGTTGLEIRERLAGRREVELVVLGEQRRKDANARRDALNSADVVIWCLPDDAARETVRTYALGLEHKHVEEMRVHAGLKHRPIFAPTVGRFYRGMLVEVPLQLWSLPGDPSVAGVHSVLADAYRGEALIDVASLQESV